MSTTTQVLAHIREERAKHAAEEARWTRYRAAANPPVWFVVFATVAAFVGLLLFASFLLKHPDAIRSPIGLLIVPFSGLLCFGAWLAQRREKALVAAMKEEAPELFEKLKSQGLIR